MAQTSRNLLRYFLDILVLNQIKSNQIFICAESKAPYANNIKKIKHWNQKKRNKLQRRVENTKITDNKDNSQLYVMGNSQSCDIM